MAASLLIEQESGTYIGRIRHSHDGYFAGDFSQTSRWAPELRVSTPNAVTCPGPMPNTARILSHLGRHPSPDRAPAPTGCAPP